MRCENCEAEIENVQECANCGCDNVDYEDPKKPMIKINCTKKSIANYAKREVLKKELNLMLDKLSEKFGNAPCGAKYIINERLQILDKRMLSKYEFLLANSVFNQDITA